MLIFFGYTYCPDVCPMGLQTISEAVDLLGEGQKWVHPIFITIDPERDTPEEMKDYVDSFHPRMIGLTGSAADIAKTAKNFRAYYSKLKSVDEDGKVIEDSDDYYMGHTTSIHLLGTDGKRLETFNFSTPPETIAERMRHFINVQESLAKSGRNK